MTLLTQLQKAKGKTPQFMLDHPKGLSRLVDEVYAKKMQIKRIKSGISTNIKTGQSRIKQKQEHLDKNSSQKMIQGHLSLYEGVVDSCNAFMKDLQAATIQYTQDLLEVADMAEGENYQEEVEDLANKEMNHWEEYVEKIQTFLAESHDVANKAEKLGSKTKETNSKPSSRTSSPADKTGQHYNIPHLEPKKLTDEIKAKEAAGFMNDFRDWLNGSYPHGYHFVVQTQLQLEAESWG